VGFQRFDLQRELRSVFQLSRPAVLGAQRRGCMLNY
jgi:hypothetical protein